MDRTGHGNLQILNDESFDHISRSTLSLAAVLLYPDRLAVHLMPSMIFDFNHGNLLNAAWLPPHNAEGQHSLRSVRNAFSDNSMVH